MEEKKATRMEMSGGAVWRWPHSTSSFSGLKAAEYEVRDIAERGITVILCQDGISGWEDEVDDDDDELVSQANGLLNFRWYKMRLMDAIVNTHEFAAGDFEASFEAGFKRVDEEVVKIVPNMTKTMDRTTLDWTLPVVWQALYNTLVVVVTPKEVYAAGCGSFRVDALSRTDVTSISSLHNLRTASAKCILAGGVRPEDFLDEGDELAVFPMEERARLVEVTLKDTFRKYILKEEDECIVVEQSTPYSMCGNLYWLQHDKDWGAALTALSEDIYPGLHFEAILLELERPKESSACLTGPVFSPTKMWRPVKKHKTTNSVPPSPSLIVGNV